LIRTRYAAWVGARGSCTPYTPYEP